MPGNIESEVTKHLERVGDPSEDGIWHRDNLLRLGALAAVGVTSAVFALAVAGRYGYEKWKVSQDQDQRLLTILIANRALLFQAGEEGRQAFVGNLDSILHGDELDMSRKVRFLQALTQDQPIDIYFKKGGLAIWKYDADGVITGTLERIRQEFVSEEITRALDQTVSAIREKTKQLSPPTP